MVGFAIIHNLINAIIAKHYYPYAFTKEEDRLSKCEIKDLFKDLGALFIYKINSVVLKATDNLVLSYFIGLNIVGLYSNYLLFGTDSSEDIKLETDWPSSLLANKTYNSNEDYDEGYFDSLIKKLESFAAAFSKSYQEKELEDEEKYELIISLIESIKISLNAAKGYAGKSALTEQQLKDLSVEKVKEYYSSFTDSDNSILQKIADNNVGLSQAMKENNTDAIEYYSRDLSRTEGNLVADVIRSSAWIYDMVSENGSEK